MTSSMREPIRAACSPFSPQEGRLRKPGRAVPSSRLGRSRAKVQVERLCSSSSSLKLLREGRVPLILIGGRIISPRLWIFANHGFIWTRRHPRQPLYQSGHGAQFDVHVHAYVPDIDGAHRGDLPVSRPCHLRPGRTSSWSAIPRLGTLPGEFSPRASTRPRQDEASKRVLSRLMSLSRAMLTSMPVFRR